MFQTINGFDDLEKRFNELNELIRERWVLEDYKNNNEEYKKLIEQQEELNALTTTEKIIAEFEAEKRIIEEKKALKEIELAETEFRLKQEELYYQWLEDQKEKLEKKFEEYKAQIEEQITDKVYQESKKRIEALKMVEAQAIATANALRGAWLSAAWSISNDNTSNNGNTITNSPSIVVHATVNNWADIDQLANAIWEKVILSSKWIY